MLFRLAAASSTRPGRDFEDIGARKLTERESDGNPWPVWGIEINSLEELMELIKRYDFGSFGVPVILIEPPAEGGYAWEWEDRTIKVPEIKFYDDYLE